MSPYASDFILLEIESWVKVMFHDDVEARRLLV